MVNVRLLVKSRDAPTTIAQVIWNKLVMSCFESGLKFTNLIFSWDNGEICWGSYKRSQNALCSCKITNWAMGCYIFSEIYSNAFFRPRVNHACLRAFVNYLDLKQFYDMLDFEDARDLPKAHTIYIFSTGTSTEEPEETLKPTEAPETGERTPGLGKCVSWFSFRQWEVGLFVDPYNTGC